MAALVAAAIEPEAISAAEVTGASASLKQLIEEDKTVETLPELFAFGLLAEFDIRQIVALAAPRPIVFREPSDRARRELAPLAAWYVAVRPGFRSGPMNLRRGDQLSVCTIAQHRCTLLSRKSGGVVCRVISRTTPRRSRSSCSLRRRNVVEK